MDLGLAGQVFLVSGGSKGLGYAGAAALRREGAEVVLSARSPDGVRAAAEALGCTGLAADLADAETAGRLVETALATYGRLDGALISVGGPPPGSAMELTDEQWQAAFSSVLLAPLRRARTVVGQLPAEGGSIAFVLSSSVKAPVDGLAASNGLRPGLAMLAKTLADELGPRGVRVNGLLPGRILTDRLRELDGDDPAVHAARAGSIPLRRYGQPDEFGRVAAFVLSPAASYLSGAMVPVDGGAVRAL